MASRARRRRREEVMAQTLSSVIPGRDVVASPESITTIGSMDSGLAPKEGAPRNDEEERA
jgi:hypothetical protein